MGDGGDLICMASVRRQSSSLALGACSLLRVRGLADGHYWVLYGRSDGGAESGGWQRLCTTIVRMAEEGLLQLVPSMPFPAICPRSIRLPTVAGDLLIALARCDGRDPPRTALEILKMPTLQPVASYALSPSEALAISAISCAEAGAPFISLLDLQGEAHILSQLE